MKKLFFLLAMCLLMAACSSHLDEPQMAELPETDGQSDYLTPAEACEIASDAYAHFYGAGETTTSSRSIRKAYAHFYLADNLSRSENPALYVVEFEEGGFAVVNAHKIASTQIYAVVEEGQFDESNNPGLKHFMESTDERVRAEAKANSETQPASRMSGMIGGGAISPFKPLPFDKGEYLGGDSIKRHIYVKWSRYAPYNAFCAIKSGDTRYDLGSFPTATGMLVAHYRYNDKPLEYMIEDKVCDCHWPDMLAANNYNALNATGKNDVAFFLNYLGERYEGYYFRNGQFLGIDKLERFVKGFYGNSNWFKDGMLVTDSIPFNYLFEDLRDYGPQLMYGETSDGEFKDMWIVEGAKYEKYKSHSLSAVDENGNPIYDSTYTYRTDKYLYINWGVAGASNGWYNFGTMYANNAEDVSPYGTFYKNNMSTIVGIRFVDWKTR